MELESLRVFIKVAEVQSFTSASAQLGISKSRVSERVAGLESSVGARLLQRTTRTVRLTPDGERFLDRARALVQDADELGTLFHAARGLRGQVRVDLPNALARDVVVPRLPELLARHPLLELQISTTDRRVEVVREGFDFVLRVGDLQDSELVARRLGAFAMVNCASPAYLRRYGVPRELDDLDQHWVVHYAQHLAHPPTFEYPDPRGDGYLERPVRAMITVNGTDAYKVAALAGLGIVQTPRRSVRGLLEEGALVEVLPDHPCAPMPVSILHPHGRRVPKRVQAVMTWMSEVVTEHLA